MEPNVFGLGQKEGFKTWGCDEKLAYLLHDLQVLPSPCGEITLETMFSQWV